MAEYQWTYTTGAVDFGSYVIPNTVRRDGRNIEEGATVVKVNDILQVMRPDGTYEPVK